jgi:transcriptional regulator with XRE-family HTH domain
MDYNDIYALWHRNFVRECKKKEMELIDLANDAGTSKTNVCCYLTGSIKPSPRQMIKLCNKWNIPLDKVFCLRKLK